MAESLDDGEFWLPARFLTDDDILMDKGNIKNSSSKDGVLTGVGFISRGIDFFGPPSDLSSPVESVNGSTETESDEEDYLAGLTRQIAQTALQDELAKIDQGFAYESKKAWGISRSPQSTLCAVGGACSCKQGSSRGSPNGPRVSSPPATWDLLHAAAGEVAKMRMNDEEYGYQYNRGLLVPRRKPTPVAVPVKNVHAGAGFYSHHSISHQQFQAAQFQQLKQQQMVKEQRKQAVWEGQQPKGTGIFQPRQMFSNRGKTNEVRVNRSSRPLGLSHSAWPPLQAHQQQQQQQQTQQSGSGMRVVFLGTPGSRKECAGTGVFLPRRVGNPPEMRKKSGCSTALLPARVVQALNLNLDNVGSQTQLHPRLNGGHASLTDAGLNLRSSYGFAPEQKPALRVQPVTNHEIRLPQEWTY